MGKGQQGLDHGRVNVSASRLVSSMRGGHIGSDRRPGATSKEDVMAQTDNPFLDGVAKAFTDAAGMAQSVRTEIDTFMRQRLERLVADMDFVPREEFEAVKAMAAKARAENEALAARVAALESKSGT
jgi:BMFP domain-containing protein YqiC